MQKSSMGLSIEALIRACVCGYCHYIQYSLLIQCIHDVLLVRYSYDHPLNAEAIFTSSSIGNLFAMKLWKGRNSLLEFRQAVNLFGQSLSALQ